MDWLMREVWGDNAGVRISALEWSPEATSTALGLPIVFVPGGTGNAWSGEAHGQAAATGAIGSLRRRLLSVSRRGMGASDAPARGYTPLAFAEDVRAAIRAAGYQRFVVFGHSMGVPISLELALRDSHGIAAIVLGDGPAHYINLKEAKTLEPVLARPFTYASWDAAFEDASLKTDDRVADRVRFDRIRHRYFFERDGQVHVQIDRAALQKTVDDSVASATTYWARLPELKMPIVLLRATKGWSPVGDEDVAHYRSLLPQIEVVELPTEHDLGQRTEPRLLHDALGRLLDRLDAPSPIPAT